jgi:hypothetical protein
MDMSQHGKGSSTHNTQDGFDIEYADPGGTGMPTMKIGGVDVMVRREETGGYSAPMLNMHATFGTLDELARDVVANSPVFTAAKHARGDAKKGG